MAGATLRGMFLHLFGKRRVVPRVSTSRLENLFVDGNLTVEADKVLLNRLACSCASKHLAMTICNYAGMIAPKLRDAIISTKESYADIPVGERSKISCDFDPLFVETVALCFWSVMSKFWDDDEIDFWVDEESSDWDYLDELRGAIELVDAYITAVTSPILGNYLSAQLTAYMQGNSRDSDQALKRFAASVCTWALRRNTDTPSDSLTRIVTAFSFKAAGELNRAELDALCLYAYARS